MRVHAFSLGLFLTAAVCLAAPAGIEQLKRDFENPPDDARIMMRWWWFGPAVSKRELEREMRLMKEGGIGGFEVQAVYPLAFENAAYLSDEFLEALRFTGEKARELGLRMDLTLGSGWPFGGPHIPVTQAAGRLRVERVSVPADTVSIPIPYLTEGEKLIAAFLARDNRRLTDVDHGLLRVPRDAQVVLFFIASRTGQMVKRAAVGAEGFVLDHYDRAAIENHLKYAGERMLKALGKNPPYAVFSDSLEVYGSDWTGDLLDEFRKRRGYDLTPYLPALSGDIGDKTADVRHDWGETLTELANERYLTPLREFAQRHGTRFRSQTYGIPPVTLSSNALVDLPEGEGTQWRQFSATRWAASASHLYGRPVTSSETWTWLHSPVFRATPLDMKAEADLHFLQGINQLIGHGWPYSPPEAGEPGWRFYAAAVFNQHNPWWLAMPDIARYLQRVSFLLRQGQPANDVAVYLPTDDAWARFTAGHDSINQSMDALLGPNVIPQILDAGYNFDFIDDDAIASVGVPYRILILPGVERMPPATHRKLEAYASKGGIVVDTRRLTDEKQLGSTLNKLLPADVAAAPEIGFVHRKLDFADVYFLVNTSNHRVHSQAAFRVAGLEAAWWNPFNGEVTRANDGARIDLDLAPYESRVLVFSKDRVEGRPLAGSPPAPIDLSSDWRVKFAGAPESAPMHELRSWTADEQTKYFSGQATYEKTVTISQSVAGPLRLTFGEGTPVDRSSERRAANGMRAWLESPVREAAAVYVNDRLAGMVWCPPYEVNVTGLLHPGENKLRIVVANLAINAMARGPLPDYKLLNSRYGERFQPQDLVNLQPLPSGLLGPIRLVRQDDILRPIGNRPVR
ncbi:MAG TPA: glycosyl hydrolase [Bryobacteraceae bacterium]